MIFVYCSCINSFYRRTRDFYGEVFYGDVFYGEVFYGEAFYGEASYRGKFYRDVLWRKILGLYHFYTIFLPLLCLPW